MEKRSTSSSSAIMALNNPSTAAGPTAGSTIAATTPASSAQALASSSQGAAASKSTCSCGASTVEFDSSLGHSVCTACGAVLEENAIVSDVTFTETGGGATVADGFFVSKDSARAASRAGSRGGIRMGGPDSREVTFANGHRRIREIATQMKMSDRQIDIANRFFVQAVIENFTKGRKSANVAAACLYIVCRMEKTSHMLIDFAECLRTNVYYLGATFVRLVATLKLYDLPLVDPALYIVRFASKLEFEDKVQDVVRDASRLVSRMDRDWIIKGRRPAGICAACLFIAARMNGFKRTAKEVVDVVKICEATLRKRLEDFSATASSTLSVTDFQTLMLEESADPPSFTHGKAIKKRKMPPLAAIAKSKVDSNDDDDGEDGDVEITKVDEEINLSDRLAMQALLASEKLRQLAESEGVSIDEYDEDLSYLDDDLEVQNAILTQEESELKKRFWEAENRDWELVKAAQEASGGQKVVKKPRKRRDQTSSSAGAADEQGGVVSAKKLLSKKINYTFVDNLFQDGLASGGPSTPTGE